MKNKTCEWCKEALDEEEARHPNKSDNGDILCDSCYHEEYYITCVDCEEPFPKGDADYFVITNSDDPDNDDFQTGLYRIISTPFYLSNITGGDMIDEKSVKRLCNHAKDIEQSGLVCKECAIKMIETHIDEEKQRNERI